MTKPANRLRTGGPRTPIGKSVAAANSLKIGAYSVSTMMPGESISDFEQILTRLEQDFQAEDSIESLIVRQIAEITWKMMRLDRIRNQVESNIITRPIKASEIFEMGFPEKAGVAYLLDLTEPLSPEGLEALARLGNGLSSIDQMEEQRAQILKLQSTRPDLFMHIEAMQSYSSLGAGASQQSLVVVIRGLRDNDESERQLSAKRVQDLYKSLIDLSKACEHIRSRAQELQEIRSLVLDKRLIDFMDRASNSRAHEDLQRSMIRLLGELRRQKDWRKNNRVVDLKATP